MPLRFKLRWLAVVVLLGHVRGIQYDVCNDIPTSFSPKCDLNKRYMLDDYQGKVYSACRIKVCDTAIMGTYDANLESITPYPYASINQLANFTCRSRLPLHLHVRCVCDASRCGTGMSG
jgi:hypothetical protein